MLYSVADHCITFETRKKRYRITNYTPAITKEVFPQGVQDCSLDKRQTMSNVLDEAVQEISQIKSEKSKHACTPNRLSPRKPFKIPRKQRPKFENEPKMENYS